eukprot:TRINITY_DN727_c0_g1_i1.p1 TRINITY_DN727_c0_g1~~TRINITY_DN727_c0_g1_i1.p1  ORF type:complete len:183 (+),score=38.02 TRINITY_DN727_c0_g1_i1:166-714(+)
MSKVPNFTKFRSSGTNIVVNDYDSEQNTWNLHLVDCLVPEDGGFSITFKVLELVHRKYDSRGLMIAVIDIPDNIETIYSYDNTGNNKNIVNEGRFTGIGWFAFSGVMSVYDISNNINSERYKEGDEIKINIYKNKTIEFFKNNQSVNIFDLNSFNVIPAVSFSTLSDVEIIDISSLDDGEAQ